MRLAPLIAGMVVCCLGVCGVAFADGEVTEDMVGQSGQAWKSWHAAMKAMDRDEKEAAAKDLDAVLAMNLSDLRLALMADRTGAIRLEQWATAADAAASVKSIAEKVKNGQKQRAMAEDGWHFAAIGRFEYANANFKALDESNPDPVALLELARQNPNRHFILVKLLANNDVGPAAKRFLQILSEGEERLRTDQYEIASNIAKLSGPPRMSFNAIGRLKAAGEYAVPQMLDFLRDPKQRSLHATIIQTLPQIGLPALNPLCIALEAKDEVTRQVIIQAMVQIGYKQALPYLAKVADDSNASSESRAAAKQAMASIGHAAGGDRATLFTQLSEQYYDRAESLRPDPRSDKANVWYFRDDKLVVVSVPVDIFCDVMAMRCAEEALLANPNTAEATALWLAANFRREAHLGLSVESEMADPMASKDPTRPANYPRAIYFARTAGARYNHMVLARAVRDRDPGVALGAIAALAQTGGEQGLVGVDDGMQPLVAALTFPNRQVRLKAAIALGRAMPMNGFQGDHQVVPVLSEALMQSGRLGALVVDGDGQSANKLQALLRAAGYDVAVGPSLFEALQSGQKAGLATFDVALLASDLKSPDAEGSVVELRKNFETAATPILVVAKAGELDKATRAVRAGTGVEVLLADTFDLGDPAKIAEQVNTRIARAAAALGMNPLGADLSLSLALQAADVLRMIGESNLKVFDFSKSVSSLLKASTSKSEALRMRAAHVLALAGQSEAQTALAVSGLAPDRSQAERVAAFAALAESGRRNGNLLGENDLVGKLIDFAMNESDLVLRTAASQALGALDLASNKASEIIRKQYRG
jgi:CheY-like chemotaxis protein